MTKNQTKKTTQKKRGRPASKFTSKKPQIKRDKPGRPKKNEKVILPEIPQKEENKTKDIVIRILFFISVFVFGLSIYVNKQNKKLAINREYSIISELIQYQEEDINSSDALENNDEETIHSDDENIEDHKNFIEDKIDIIPIANNSDDPKFTILQNIYSEIQKSNFDTLYQNTDNILKNGSVFKKYFSKTWLQRFVNNIENLDINLTEIIDNTIYYQINYFVNGQFFTEEREADFDNNLRISRILCVTTGCSTLPFFNPGKYF